MCTWPRGPVAAGATVEVQSDGVGSRAVEATDIRPIVAGADGRWWRRRSAWTVVHRINAPFAPVVPHATLSGAVIVPGGPPVLPWPTRGQGAVMVPSLGFSAQSGPEHPVSIASLTKIATAVVILNDHPIAPGAAGPLITITAGDVAEYQVELRLDQSNIEIRTGETLTERQMLEALMTRSANDIAYLDAKDQRGQES